jgi:hypothetical protein
MIPFPPYPPFQPTAAKFNLLTFPPAATLEPGLQAYPKSNKEDKRISIAGEWKHKEFPFLYH